MTTNGALPSSALAVIVPTENVETDRVPQYTPTAAAPYLEAAAAAFRARMGRKLFVFRAYRSIDEQWRLYRGWTNTPGQIDPVTGLRFALAALPGTSNHGGDVEPAYDIWSGVDVAGSDAHRVWVEVSAPYGFRPVGLSFGRPEAWHHTWRRDRVTASLPVTPPITEKDHDTMRHLKFGPHYYSIAPGFARHHMTGREAIVARTVSGQPLVTLSQADAEAAFAAYGIPRHMTKPRYIDTEELGGTWSADQRSRGILGKIADHFNIKL